MSLEAEEFVGFQRVFRSRVCVGKRQVNAMQTGTFNTVSVYPDGQPRRTISHTFRPNLQKLRTWSRILRLHDPLHPGPYRPQPCCSISIDLISRVPPHSPGFPDCIGPSGCPSLLARDEARGTPQFHWHSDPLE